MVKMAFVTCVKLGLSCIEEIFNIGGKLDLLITLKDHIAKNKSGRVYLDKISSKYDIPLLKINNINDKEVINLLLKNEIDWLFIIGWSQIAKIELLNAPRKGCIGIHPTLLPIGRGRAAIPWAIIKGLEKTGVTMFKLDSGVDTGDIIIQDEIILEKEITATQLYEKVNKMHIELIRKKWFDITENNIRFIKQDEKFASYWPERKAKDGEIIENMSMNEAHAMVRALTHPYPGAFFLTNKRKIIIWNAKKNELEGDIKLKDGYLQLIDYEVLNYDK